MDLWLSGTDRVRKSKSIGSYGYIMGFVSFAVWTVFTYVIQRHGGLL